MLCEGLRDHLGSDAKIRDNDVLRPAWSFNHKPTLSGGLPQIVQPDNGYNTPSLDPVELGKKLKRDITKPPAPSTNGSVGVDPTDREQIDLGLYPSVVDALLKITPDRSDDTYFVVAACREAGRNLAQTRWVVDTRTDLKDRLANRTDDDVLTCWNRHAANTAWTIGSAPPPSPAAPAPPAPPSPGRFFGKTGLRALDLANEVMAGVECGFGHPDERFYTYDNGVWTAGEGPIEQEITRLLGNRYRLTHTKNVTTLIKYQPGVPASPTRRWPTTSTCPTG